MREAPEGSPFMGVIEAVGLGKRYGRKKLGLRNCTLSVPAGCVTGDAADDDVARRGPMQAPAGLLALPVPAAVDGDPRIRIVRVEQLPDVPADSFQGGLDTGMRGLGGA